MPWRSTLLSTLFCEGKTILWIIPFYWLLNFETWASDHRVKKSLGTSRIPIIKLHYSCKEPQRISSLTFIIAEIGKQRPRDRKGHTQGHRGGGAPGSEDKCTNSHAVPLGSSELIKGGIGRLTPVKVLEHSTVLIIREMQMKTTMRYHLTLVRMAIIKKSTNNKYWEGVEKKEPSYTAGGNVNWYSHCGE